MTDSSAQLRALARAHDRIDRKTTALDTELRRLAADLARLTELVTHETPAEDPPDPRPPGVRSWLLTADPEQALADLADLIVWLDRVYLCYPDAPLGPCWMWHPHVVEELWWLCRVHAEAYHPETGSWLRAADWHERQRPGVARRVRELLAKCDLSLHVAERQHGRPLPVVPLAAYGAEVATGWAGGRARPAPSAVQIEEASEYLAEQHRRHR